MPETTSYGTPKRVLDSSFTTPPHSMSVTILSGQNLVAGSLLGRQTSSGKYVLYDESGTDDGRRVCSGVLPYAVNASSSSGGQNRDVDAPMWYGNMLLDEADLVGLDSAAKTDMGARTIPGTGKLYVP